MKDPINNLIKEFFEKIGIRDKQLDDLKKEKILFILDGFDEINTDKNIYDKNDFDKFPNSKIIITCREEYFNTNEIQLNQFHIFTPHNDKNLVSLFYLMEFNKEDKEKFVENFLKLKRKNNSEEFQNWDKDKILKELSNLDKNSNFSKNPFNLNLLCSVMPEIKKNKNNINTRFNIYNTFINSMFKKEFDRIYKMDQNQNEKILKNSKKTEGEGIKEIFEFSERLALTLFKTSNLLKESEKILCIDYSNPVDNPFQEFFEDNLRTNTLRKSAPLKRIDEDKYNFIHKSIMEFFVASHIIKEFKSFDKLNDEKLQKSLLNQFILTDQPAILKFLSEYYQYQNKSEEIFFKVINRTINNINIDKLGSNCATLLNFSSKILTKRNFDNTRIPYADFQNALLMKSSFNNCNLSNYAKINLILHNLPNYAKLN